MTVAAELIHQHGEAATSIRDVKTAAGVSGSQMTHYFPTRQSLMRAVVARRAEDISALLREPILGDLDSFERLRAWAALNVKKQRQLACRGGCAFGTLVGQMAEANAEIRAEFAAGYDGWTATLAAGIAKCDRGELHRDADPEALAVGLVAAHQGGVAITQATRDVRPLESALESMIRYIETFTPGVARTSPIRSSPR